MITRRSEWKHPAINKRVYNQMGREVFLIFARSLTPPIFSSIFLSILSSSSHHPLIILSSLTLRKTISFSTPQPEISCLTTRSPIFCKCVFRISPNTTDLWLQLKYLDVVAVVNPYSKIWSSRRLFSSVMVFTHWHFIQSRPLRRARDGKSYWHAFRIDY